MACIEYGCRIKSGMTTPFLFCHSGKHEGLIRLMSDVVAFYKISQEILYEVSNEHTGGGSRGAEAVCLIGIIGFSVGSIPRYGPINVFYAGIK